MTKLKSRIGALATAFVLAGMPTLLADNHTAGLPLIPMPQSVVINSGSFHLTPKATIGYDKGLKEQAEMLRDQIWKASGMDLKLTDKPGTATISLQIDPKHVKSEEGYTLKVTPKGITIKANQPGGIFYGTQTLFQLLPPQIESNSPVRGVDWNIPAVDISDAPARPWRGMMLDVARYFFSKDFVKKYIDMMATYKLNKLQLHLIDDSGWRLEIKKYPRLTEVGAWAGEDSKRLGGYYTQDDIRELVAYGAARNVEIIPEIEFPAHILSAVVAYPELSCTGLQHEMPVQHFISRDLLCAGRQSSINFLKDVLDETIDLFPSKYINIGGDEAVYSRYAECDSCQALMKKLGLTEPSQLQGYLTNVVADMMAEKRRTVIGWEEIIQRGKVKQPVVALMWHNVNDTIQATNQGHKSILVPATHTYFDFPESSTPGEVKSATWMPPISLEKTYSMPVNDYSENSTVLGVEGALWSDQFIHGTVLQEITPIDENRSEAYFEYLTFPRLMALSEVAWAPESKRDYKDFEKRIASHYPRLDNMEVSYRVPEPIIESMKSVPGGVEFTLKPAVDGAEIRYTTNGSYPTVHSQLYTAPVTVKNKSDFHAITVVTPTHYSLPIYFAPDYSAYAQYGKFAGEWKPLQIQTSPAPLSIEVTGKVSGNGTYEITFIPTDGKNAISLGALKLMKRDELSGNDDKGASTVKPGEVKTYTVKVDNFEAGTPFHVVVEANGVGGNDTQGLLFIKKL